MTRYSPPSFLDLFLSSYHTTPACSFVPAETHAFMLASPNNVVKL